MLFVGFLLLFVHTTSVNAATCSRGWTIRDMWCYLAVPGQTTFDDASNLCGGFGAKLAWITSKEEQLFVNELTLKRGAYRYWIGLNKINGTWRLSNGDIPTFTNWRITQPDLCCGLNVTCVLVNYIDLSGLWDDAGCNYIWTQPQGYVCKIRAS